MYIKILNEQEIRMIYSKIDRNNVSHRELLNSLYVNIERKVYFLSDKQAEYIFLNNFISAS